MTSSDQHRRIPSPSPSDLPSPGESLREEEEARALYDEAITNLDRQLAVRQRSITYRNLWIFEHIVPWLFGVLVTFIFLASFFIFLVWVFHVLMPPDWHWAEFEGLSEARYFALFALAFSLLSGAGMRYFDFFRQKMQLWL